ncbi:MAG TPA: cysteine--tRNA ligase [bacterium]|nr:cysteine--tRNA ligase [bacterium]
MPLSLYNTATRKIEPFKPKDEHHVRVYACGPTPYNYAHIGNMKAYVVEDIILRAMRFLGYKIVHVMNLTDIDDKTIRDSQKTGESLRDFTQRYTDAFFEDTDRLGIIRPDVVERISDAIPEMIAITQKLLDTGYAYLAEDGSVYYRIKSFRRYGEFAHIDVSEMKDGVRVSNDEYEKESVADFALWKAYDPDADGENTWDAEFVIDGEHRTVPGRPGWHIECSALNEKHFHSEIDLHLGGIDHIFPHHQNEIAQTEAYTGRQFSRCWSHGGHLLVENKKMAKSAGNFHTLRDILSKYPEADSGLVARAFRLMILETRYRDNFNFTFERIDKTMETVRSLDELLRRMARYEASGSAVRREFREDMQSRITRFVESLENDISTPEAVALLHETATTINTGMDRREFSMPEMESLADFLRTMDSVFAIFDWTTMETADVPEEVKALVSARDEARKSKNYTEADRLRDEIDALGYQLVDDGRKTYAQKK